MTRDLMNFYIALGIDCCVFGEPYTLDVVPAVATPAYCEGLIDEFLTRLRERDGYLENVVEPIWNQRRSMTR